MSGNITNHNLLLTWMILITLLVNELPAVRSHFPA